MKTIVKEYGAMGGIIVSTSQLPFARELTQSTHTGTMTTISFKDSGCGAIHAQLSTAVTSPGGDFRDDVEFRDHSRSVVPPGKTVALRVDGPTPQSQRILLVTREK